MKWRIIEPHYLKVRFKNPNNGQPEVYEVLFEASSDNPIELGVGTMARAGSIRAEFIYDGPPTPNMEPLDKEAEKAKAEYEAAQAKRLAVINPIEQLPTHG